MFIDCDSILYSLRRMVFFVLLSWHIICLAIASQRRFTRSFICLKQSWVALLTWTGMAWSWSYLTSILRHDRLELVSTCDLRNAMVSIANNIGMQVTVRAVVNSIDVLVQVVHAVWPLSALDRVSQRVYWNVRLGLISTIIMIVNIHWWEISCSILVLALLILW